MHEPLVFEGTSSLDAPGLAARANGHYEEIVVGDASALDLLWLLVRVSSRSMA